MSLQRWYKTSFPDPDTEYEIIPTHEETIILLSFVISNPSSEYGAEVFVKYVTESGEGLSWRITLPANSTPFALDSQTVLLPGDKVVAKSSVELTSLWVSGAFE